MSATTRTVLLPGPAILSDYDILHSPQPAASSTPSPEPLDVEVLSQTTDLPSTWNVNSLSHRRVPQYRPVNRERDQRNVRVYTGPIEQAFIFVMFTGVWTHAVSAPATGPSTWDEKRDRANKEARLWQKRGDALVEN